MGLQWKKIAKFTYWGWGLGCKKMPTFANKNIFLLEMPTKVMTKICKNWHIWGGQKCPFEESKFQNLQQKYCAPNAIWGLPWPKLGYFGVKNAKIYKNIVLLQMPPKAIWDFLWSKCAYLVVKNANLGVKNAIWLFVCVLQMPLKVT